MVEVRRRVVTGVVIPFPRARAHRRATRRARRAGEILLFTGVRYERMPDPGPEPVARPPRSFARRRRRSA